MGRHVSLGQSTRERFNGRVDHMDGRWRDVGRCSFLTISILLTSCSVLLPSTPHALWIVGVYDDSDYDDHSSLLSDVGSQKALFSVVTARRLTGGLSQQTKTIRTST